MNAMSDEASEHLWFQDRVGAYLAGGLSDQEAQRFDAHAAACGACAAMLEAMRSADASMKSLFADAVPPVDYEERLVGRLRGAAQGSPSRLGRIHPVVRRAALGVAATLVIGVCGYVGSRALQQGSLGRGAGPYAAVTTVHPQTAQSSYQIRDLITDVPDFDKPPNLNLQATDHGDVDKIVEIAGDVARPILSGASGSAIDGPNQVNHNGYAGDVSFSMKKRADSNGLRSVAEARGTPSPKMDEGVVNDRITDSESAHKEVKVVKGVNDPNGGRQSPGYAADYYAYYPIRPLLVARNPTPGDISLGGGSLKLDAQNTFNDVVVSSGASQTFAGATITNATATGFATSGAGAPTVLLPAGTADGIYGRPPLDIRLQDPAKAATKLQVAAKDDSAKSSIASSANGSADPMQPTTAPAQRHVIRNGQMEFEVDSFDSAALQVAKIVGEEGGFVDTTNSQKLPNGKVQGTVIVRVPPENLDILILKLRGIGDLKSQNISAQDVTKEYTDIESQLRAAQAMETRLLDLIKQGKGEIKDLLAAEKELGVWREKIDGMEGQIRYYNNLISLSTLSIALMERDIRAAYAAMETETVSAGVETENVEKARSDALKAIDEAQGRVIESDLNKLDADQYKGTIVAEVPAEKAGSVIDALRQLGRVARLDVQRKQTTEGGAIPVAMAASLKIQRQQTRFDITLYNLANVPARQTVTATLACRDVDKAYHDILAVAEGSEPSPVGQPPAGQAAGRKVGRVLASNLNTQRAGQVSGLITLEVRSELAPTMDAILHHAGEVMHLAVTENADANNVTSTKRGYTITLDSLSQVPPRQTTTMSVAARDVPGFYHKLLDKLQDGKLDSRILNAELNEQDRLRVAGMLDFEIARTDLPVIDALLGVSGESDVFERVVTRSPDDQSTVDSKVRLTLRVINADQLLPRETTDAHIEAADVEQAATDIAAAAQGAGGRTVERQLSKQQGGAMEVHMVVDVPLAGAGALLDRLRAAGTVREMTSAKNLQVSDGSLARAQFTIMLGNSQLMVTPEGSVSARFHEALQTSVKGLLFVLQYLVVGVLLVGPIALVIWGGWRVVGRVRRGAREAKPA